MFDSVHEIWDVTVEEVLADDPELTEDDFQPSQFDYVSPEQYAQDELESEYRAGYDDHAERYAAEALDPEYEAWCDDMSEREARRSAGIDDEARERRLDEILDAAELEPPF